MQIAIPLFDRFTALDAVGPYEVLSRLPGARVDFVAATAGAVRTETRMLALDVERTFDEVAAPEVIVVPGGVGSRRALHDERLLDWLRTAHAGSRFTTSVCTGALILQAGGVLDGLEATTHWLALDLLERPLKQRVVERGKVITAAGVSAGIDMALTLADRIAGADVAQAIQLGIEYDPAPPFDSGSPDKAPESVLALVEAAQRAEEAEAEAAAA
jgi:putative intracellular protease/amidase